MAGKMQAKLEIWLLSSDQQIHQKVYKLVAVPLKVSIIQNYNPYGYLNQKQVEIINVINEE